MYARLIKQTSNYASYIDSKGNKINLRLFVYPNAQHPNRDGNKVERTVYGPDGYYRPDLSFDTENVDEYTIRQIFG